MQADRAGRTQLRFGEKEVSAWLCAPTVAGRELGLGGLHLAVFGGARPFTIGCARRLFVSPVDGTRKGQRNLADVFIAGQSNPDEIVPLQTPLPVFRCPSDGTPALVPCEWSDGSCKADNPSQAANKGLWVRSFLGNNSSALTPRFLPSTSNYVGNRGMIDAGCPVSGATQFGTCQEMVSNTACCDSDGVFFGDSEISTKNITDGTSKTFMIGERDEYCLAATWIGARNRRTERRFIALCGPWPTPLLPSIFRTTTAYDNVPKASAAHHEGRRLFCLLRRLGAVHQR